MAEIINLISSDEDTEYGGDDDNKWDVEVPPVPDGEGVDAFTVGDKFMLYVFIHVGNTTGMETQVFRVLAVDADEETLIAQPSSDHVAGSMEIVEDDGEGWAIAEGQPVQRRFSFDELQAKRARLY